MRDNNYRPAAADGATDRDRVTPGAGGPREGATPPRLTVPGPFGATTLMARLALLRPRPLKAQSSRTGRR